MRLKFRRSMIARRGAGHSSSKSSGDPRRFATRVSLGIVIVGAIVALVAVANRWSRREEMRQVRIVGRNILDSAEIMQRASIADSIPLRELRLGDIEKKIAAHPFIASASVYRGENGTLVVEVCERAPVAATVIDAAVYYVDSLGALLPHRFSAAGSNLPLLAGIAATSYGSSEMPKLDSAATTLALAVLKQIRLVGDNLYSQISEVQCHPSGECTLLTSDGGITVRAGSIDGIGGRLNKLDLFLRRVVAVRGTQNIASIDLRWRGQVVVRWRRGASA